MSSSVLPALCTHAPISFGQCDYKRLHKLFYYIENDGQSKAHRPQQGDFINEGFRVNDLFKGEVSNFCRSNFAKLNCINNDSGRNDDGSLTHIIGWDTETNKAMLLKNHTEKK